MSSFGPDNLMNHSLSVKIRSLQFVIFFINKHLCLRNGKYRTFFSTHPNPRGMLLGHYSTPRPLQNTLWPRDENQDLPTGYPLTLSLATRHIFRFISCLASSNSIITILCYKLYMINSVRQPLTRVTTQTLTITDSIFLLLCWTLINLLMFSC